MKLIFLLLSAVLITSCSLNNDAFIKPKKIIQSIDYEHYDTLLYTYEGSNIKKIQYYDRYNILDYKGENFVKENIAQNGYDEPWLIIEYFYNDPGKIERVHYSSLGWTDDSLYLNAMYFYEYENDMVSKEYYYDNQYALDTLFYNTFEYDSAGNIIKKVTFTRDTLNKVFYLDYETLYEYDSKHHYLKNVNYQQYGMFYSKVNNVVKEVYNHTGSHWQGTEPTVIDYEYYYNENNFPVVCIKDGVDTTMKITYYE